MKRLMSSYCATLSALAILSVATPAYPQWEARTAEDVVRLSWVAGWRQADGTHMAGLRIELAPGWKTYWRAPGEGGVPTELHLTSAEGVTSMAIHWPRPEVFFTNGMRSIGYRGDVVLPVQFTLDEVGDVAITGRVEMGVCLDVCMPIALDIEGALPIQTDGVPELRRALSNLPFSALEAGAGDTVCAVEPIEDGVRVTVSADLGPVGRDETMVVEHRDPMVWVSEAEIERVGDQVVGVVDVVPMETGSFILDQSDLRITVIGTQMAVELDACLG